MTAGCPWHSRTKAVTDSEIRFHSNPRLEDNANEHRAAPLHAQRDYTNPRVLVQPCLCFGFLNNHTLDFSYARGVKRHLSPDQQPHDKHKHFTFAWPSQLLSPVHIDPRYKLSHDPGTQDKNNFHASCSACAAYTPCSW